MARARRVEFPKPTGTPFVATSFDTLKKCIADAMTRLGSPQGLTEKQMKNLPFIPEEMCPS
ncbi:MAG: hypothetical protein IPG43_04090 [Proteobacteria bacterium]|nr:hypothetical protein [Pseudomonadota bacterium]